MNIDKSLYVPPSTQQAPYVALQVRRALPVVKVGAILDVLVASQHNRNNYTLRLGRETVQAYSEKPLPVGSRQALKVLAIDQQGKLSAQIVSATESRITQALQARSYTAQPLSRVLQILISQNNVQVPAATQNTLAQVLESIPQKKAIFQPQQLARAIRESGVFLESRLAQGDVPVRDFKGLLLALWQQLSRGNPANIANTANPLPKTYGPPPALTTGGEQAPPAPLNAMRSSPEKAPQALVPRNDTSATSKPMVPAPSSRVMATNNPLQLYQQVSQQPSAPPPPPLMEESPYSLLRAVESGIARLESHQLTAGQARENQQLIWLLELPVRNGGEIDVWQFLLQRETPDDKKNTPEREARYRVSLSVELPAVGLLTIEIDYSESATRFNFYSKNADILAAINQRSSSLKARLSSQGIEQTSIAAHFGEGKLPVPSSSAPPPLDTHA